MTKLVEQANRKTAQEFLEHLLEVVPYKIPTNLTDNGIEFAERPGNCNSITRSKMRFDLICEANGIAHRLTKPNHPWTNGQVERMNRTIKEATVKRYHDDNHQQLRSHLQAFVRAYNFAKRLKTLRGLTPYEYVCKIWTKEPERFKTNSLHHNNMGPNRVGVTYRYLCDETDKLDGCTSEKCYKSVFGSLNMKEDKRFREWGAQTYGKGFKEYF